MLDNSKRGSRTLFWMKFVLASMIVEVALLSLIYVMYGQALQATDPISAETGLSFLVLVVLVILCSLCVGLSLVVEWLYWLFWLYCAEKNLRTMASTRFSPILAIICSCLPWIGQLFHYFVLKDMVNVQQGILQSRGLRFVEVPAKMMDGWLAMMIAAAVISFWGESHASTLFIAVLSLVAFICYIKVFEAYIGQELVLWKFFQEEELRKKVDEVLREREIEKAASEVQAAMYDKAADGAPCEPPPPPQNS